MYRYPNQKNDKVPIPPIIKIITVLVKNELYTTANVCASILVLGVDAHSSHVNKFYMSINKL
jgi:hypothetical protein